MEKIKAQKKCLTKIAKYIVGVMHILKNVMQTFTSKNNLFKTNESRGFMVQGCVM
jgi:hypothetical protein